MVREDNPTVSTRREQALENCRWLFGQEVQIITFFHSTPYGYSAVVLPKACSLRSLSQCEINEKVLWKATVPSRNYLSREDAINTLLVEVEGAMSKILTFDADKLLQINKLAIPAICGITDDIPTDPETTGKLEPGEGEEQEDTVSKEAMTSGGDVISTKEALSTDEQVEGSIKTKPKKAPKKKKKSKTGKRRIWRVVGYTSSGEPLIEEHEPETRSTNRSFKRRRLPMPTNAKTEPTIPASEHSEAHFMPGTSVISDTDTVTAPLSNHSNWGKQLKDAHRKIDALEREILNFTVYERMGRPSSTDSGGTNDNEDEDIGSSAGDLHEQHGERLDHWLDNFVYVDGCPIVPEEKKQIFIQFLCKKLDEAGKTNPHTVFMPLNPETKMTEGYAFIEYEAYEQALAACEQLNGLPLDKKHTISVKRLRALYNSAHSCDSEEYIKLLEVFEKVHNKALEAGLQIQDLEEKRIALEEEIATLKQSLFEAESARDTEIQLHTETKAQLTKETLRADQSEAREIETKAGIEKLFGMHKG